ncbi:hypothetical protein [Aquisalinus flavus]|uniref:Uncharacterized protein n=1 Tax=Aquisalinus flavus TaxID=1526572 RepID=A0A8J2Y6A8_9PROT|nr:hypothetical protein [Aquisalinus flavus]MBD0426473.1 hypothetical protein [Aquisalinus flavus]UNE47973.1 hypothetical protein FF099_07895 [Aquisalinus flavus]GGD07659.1 hypothetical protein GCM10011342_15630 [Aquisalinus flavus]
MIWLGLAFVAMFAVVYGHVFMRLGGSSKRKMQDRMDRRAAKIDYIRLARETDEANRRRKQAGSGAVEASAEAPEKTPQAEDEAGKPVS